MTKAPNIRAIHRSLFQRDDVQVWQNSLLFASCSGRPENEDETTDVILDAIRQGRGTTMRLVPSLATAEHPAISFCESTTSRSSTSLDELGVVAWRADLVTMQFIEVSPSAEHLLGYPVSEWLSQANFWVEHLHPDDRSRAMARRRETIVSGEKVCYDYRMIAKSGAHIEVREISCVHKHGDGQNPVLHGCLMPAGQVEVERQPAQVEYGQLRQIVGEMPGLVWACDKKLNVIRSLGSDFLVLKLQAEQPRNANLTNIFPDDDPRRIHVGMHLRAVHGECVNYEVCVASRTYQVVLKPLMDERRQFCGCVGAAVDITERKWTEEQLVHLAITDPLTGLANYRSFHDTLGREITRSSRTGRPFALLLLDLDGLKQVNDSHGHLTGSRALCRLGDALRAGCRSMDTAARFGGDEFGVILPEADLDVALAVARRISEGLWNDGEEPRISVSIGAAVYARDGETADALFAVADGALYGEKRRLCQSRKKEALFFRQSY